MSYVAEILRRLKMSCCRNSASFKDELCCRNSASFKDELCCRNSASFKDELLQKFCVVSR